MIRFDLKCSNDHTFDSWFQSGAAYEKLRTAGMVTCATCGDTDITKTLMAPAVSTTGNTPAPSLQTPSDAETAIATLREKVESTSDYVGENFVTEARAMHDGTTPERAIYGEAPIEEARKMHEDGIPVIPLPFLPRKKAN